MESDTLTKHLHNQLVHLLQMYDVGISQPNERMLRLEEVPVGRSFNHPSTNVLLYEVEGVHPWNIFVDEDLVYRGSDQVKQQEFQGESNKGWRRLHVNGEVPRDVNAAIVWLLHRLDSELRQFAPEAIARDSESLLVEDDDATAPAIETRFYRQLRNEELSERGLKPTADQHDVVLRVAESVMRETAPRFPLLLGAAGLGKTIVARWAADELRRRGSVQTVVELRCSSIATGTSSMAERDGRLRTLLDQYSEDPATLLIAEQLERVLIRSVVAGPLIADALDRGLKLIGIGSPEFVPRPAILCEQLDRRIERCALAAPDQAEVLDILQRSLRRNPLAANLHLSQDVLPLVARLASRRAGANPAAAVGLLAAVISRAAFAGSRHVGPDDVFHLTH